MSWTEKILDAPIVPTVYPGPTNVLCAFAEALADEGYPAIELLARPCDAALDVMRQIAERPERRRLLWGIGTIRNRQEAEAAVAQRPDFVVSPAFSRAVLEVAARAEVPYIPGVQTFQDTQDVFEAFAEHGIEVKLLKLCPIFHLSAEYIEALRGCFPGIAFCPTGEVTIENYAKWKRIPGIVAPMGSQFIPREWIEAKDIPAIRSRLRELRRLADGLPTSNRTGQIDPHSI